MRVLYVDCFAGISGDMFLAALLDAGLPLAALEQELRKLPLEEGQAGWELRQSRAARGAFSACRFEVRIGGAAPEQPGWVHARAHEHGHDHGHGGHDGHDGHDHGHDHGHDYGHDHGHDHGHDGHDRRWSQIRAMIQEAPLAPRVRTRALEAFGRLAEAEGRVHGIPAEQVAFHEVGAVDSILDMVGVCVGLEWLGIDRVICGPIPASSGTARTAHGLIPLPAPATLELLKGFVLQPVPWPGEHVTPTGAALLAALATQGQLPAMRVERIGYGAGARDPGTHANVLRVLIGEGDADSAVEIVELRAQVDDLPGEAVPPLIEALLAAGAIDALCQPVLMKKGRPGLLVTALAAPADRVAVGEALLRHSGSFGYRWEAVRREVLSRDWEAVATPWGSVRIKIGHRGGERLHAAPEFEDCRKLAASAGVALHAVYAAALAAWSIAAPPSPLPSHRPAEPT